MKLTKVHLFVMLLLALVFCSFMGGSCASLEGFNVPSDSSEYGGTVQHSNTPSSYDDLHKANDRFSKQQEKVNNRKNKSLPLSAKFDANDDVSSKYAPYDGSNFRNNAHKSGQGIPASQILPGQEDLYILKSSIVPPVCPSCPSVKCDSSGGGDGGGGGEKKCPPCPPCARCPEPAFECKKVPNYVSGDDNVLPRPVLTSFSQFGL